MDHEHTQAGTGTDNSCHGTGEDQSDSHNSQEPPPGTGTTPSINPATSCPETVLVAVMADGSYLLMAYPHREPAAFVTRDEAGLLREALTAAFQNPGDEDSNATGTAAPGHTALPTEQA
jgi:hypothetical protein